MRVISMQGREVWDILQRDGVYYAELGKTRERQNYWQDVEKLGGIVPIWCWAYPEMNFVTMYSGEILEYLRCEMSLQQENCWDNFYMLELEIDKSLMHKGMTHNGCPYAFVFAELRLDMVKSVYEVHDSPTEMGWYFKVITPIWTYGGSDIMFAEPLDCEYWDSVEMEYTSCLSESGAGKCLRCGKITPYTYKGKHFCCLAHMWKHKQQYIQSCSFYGVHYKAALGLYDLYADEDFVTGVHDRVKFLYDLNILEER